MPLDFNRKRDMEIVVFSGAGISAESGISTFRDTGGLWEKYKIEEVATPDAFQRNPKLVLDFYNQRRRQIEGVEPNGAHYEIVRLESVGNVNVITQNIDNLHERAGSKNVLHLHGCITQAKSSLHDQHYIDIGFNDICVGDRAADGSQLRPHVVWFGEAVPAYNDALELIKNTDVLITVGTSLNVYPAAGLVFETDSNCKHYVIDPNVNELNLPGNFNLIKKNASEGMKSLVQRLTNGQINSR